ncbi:MAG: HAMP domain-containing sensor histidine kinase [Planctomycetota bacterium]
MARPDNTSRDPNTGLFHVEHAEAALEQLESTTRSLEQLREELTESERLASLGTLVGLIAHEVNNLLTPVVGYTSAALQPNASVDLQRKALERAQAGARRAAEISESILKLGGGGRFAPAGLDQGSADPYDCFRSALLCLARPLERDSIELEVSPETCDARVAISPPDLQQVLLNLLLNGRKAMLPRRSGGFAGDRPAGGVLSFHVEPGSEHIELRLQDTGVGIDQSRVQQVFRPFETDGSGTGLGLALCRELVTRAGGEIWFESKPNAGTVFGIRLPRAI